MSHCKACDKMMTNKDMLRMDHLSGDFSELCGKCLAYSDIHVTEQTAFYETLEEEGRELDRSPNLKRFNAMVKKHNLESSWAEGLGLMPRKQRVEHMRNRAWATYLDNLKGGHQPVQALEMALGLRARGDFRNATQGVTVTGEGGGTNVNVADQFAQDLVRTYY